MRKRQRRRKTHFPLVISLAFMRWKRDEEEEAK